MSAIKRGREMDNDFDINIHRRMRYDLHDVVEQNNELNTRVSKIERSNIRRCKRLKDMERQIYRLEEQIEEMHRKTELLNCIANDYKKENEYLRGIHYSM